MGGWEIATKPVEAVLFTEPTFEPTGDFGHRLVILQSATMSDHPAGLQKVIPRHQSAIRRERLIAAAQVKLPARRHEFKIQFSFTHWVNQCFVRFRLQTLEP